MIAGEQGGRWKSQRTLCKTSSRDSTVYLGLLAASLLRIYLENIREHVLHSSHPRPCLLERQSDKSLKRVHHDRTIDPPFKTSRARRTVAVPRRELSIVVPFREIKCAAVAHVTFFPGLKPPSFSRLIPEKKGATRVESRRIDSVPSSALLCDVHRAG